MNFQPNSFYHIYNQGNNRELIFFNTDNYLYFLNKMNTLKKYSDILAYCLMPNHFHWLIKTKDFEYDDSKTHPLIRSIANLLSSYTQAINKQEKRSGSLFRSKTKSKEINDPNYALICFLYIHQNPLRAGLVNNCKDWKFMSYRDYAGLRNGKLCSRKVAISDFELPTTFEDFVVMSNSTIPEEHVRKIY